MPASKAEQKAIAKYKAAHYERIALQVRFGDRERIQAHAAKHDASTNAFILRAIRQCMLDDGAAAADLPSIPDTVKK